MSKTDAIHYDGISKGRSEELDFKHPKIDLMTKVFKNG